MEENVAVSNANICRVCMAENPNNRSIFSNLSDDKRTISDVLSFVTNIQVKPNDMFSKKICSDCEFCLHELDKFKRRCIENEAKLQGFLDGTDLATAVKKELDFRPYQCSLCYLQYSDVTELQSHVFTSHERKRDTRKVDSTILLKETDKNFIKQEVTEPSEYLDDSFADNDTYNNASYCEIDLKVDTEKIAPKEEEINTKFECAICKTFYKTQKSFRKHVRLIHDKQKTVLEPKTANSYNLERESEQSLSTQEKELIVTDYECKSCGTYYKNQYTLRNHIRIIHEKHKPTKQITKPVKFDKHQCNHCMQQFVKKTSLIAHLKRHEKKTSHICALCKREFLYKAHLDNHILSIHTTQDGHKCDDCGSSFPTPESLEIHRSCHDGQKKHQCNICSKSFQMLSTLKDHKRVHTGEKPFLCPMCGKGFSQNTNLQEHMRRHAGIKAFSCDLCDKRFVAKGELSAHLRKHSGAHPFVCVECGGRFTTSSSLVKHRRTHSGERPYACDLCHMRFAASGTLKNHRRTHTGEKPYKCSHCDKAFAQKNDLTSHTRCHTGERPYVCPVCGQAFRQGSALKTHLKMHPMIQDSGRHLELQ